MANENILDKLHPGEVLKIKAAQEAFEKDPTGPSQVTINLNPHVHREYPLVVYKGKESLTVANEHEEAKAKESGYERITQKAAMETGTAAAIN